MKAQEAKQEAQVAAPKKLEALSSVDSTSASGHDDAVFEIIDYTLASPWEKFIAQIESVFRQWHLDGESYVTKPKPTSATPTLNNALREAFNYEGQSYQLIYHFTPPEEKRDSDKMRRSAEGRRRSLREEEKEEAWPTWFPDELKAMMNSSSDFPSRAHHLQRWFGLRDFLILAPLSDKGCGESEASLLLSTLSIVINDTKCPLPVFVPIGERWRGQYMGYLAAGVCVRFDSVLKHSIPSCAYSLEGLLALMYRQLGIKTLMVGPRNLIDFSVSARYTRVKGEWSGDEWKDPERFDTLLKENDYRQTGYWEKDLLWGTSEDPVDTVQLAEAWINLTPTSAKKTGVERMIESFPWGVTPKWALRAIFRDKSLCYLTEAVKEMMEAYDYSKSFTSFAELKSPMSGIVGEGEVPHLFNAMGSIRRTLAASLRYGHLPTPEEIDAIMQDLFDGKRKFVAGAVSTLHLKASPPGTLLASLSAQLLNMRTLHGMALVWLEFVKELRWHWEERVQIPAVATSHIDYNSCLLYQKLQMLNYCIGRARVMENRDTEGVNKFGGLNNLNSMDSSPLHERTDSEDYTSLDEDKGIKSPLSRDPGGLMSPYSYSGYDVTASLVSSRKLALGLQNVEDDTLSSEGDAWDTEGWDNDLLFSDDDDDKGRRTPKPGKPTRSQSTTPGGEDSDGVGGGGNRQSFTTPRRALSRADSGNRLRTNLGRSFDSVDSLLNGQRKGSMGSKGGGGALGSSGCASGSSGGGGNTRQTSDEDKRHQRRQEKAREKELGVKRRGVAERAEGLALLNSGLAVYVPHTQDHGWMTEDMIREQEDILASLGSSAEAQQIRARMQSATLLSDMQAFKAANPGAVLEDFVRWYSPADWIEQPEDKAKLHIDHVTEMWAKEKATRAEKQSADLAKAEAETEHSSGTKAVGDDEEEEKSEEKSEDESEDEEEKEEEEEREIDDDEPQEESDEARPRVTTKKVNAKKAAERKSATAEDEEGVRYWPLDDAEGLVGHLSQRMQMPGNLWRQVWREAQPLAIREQKLLFDHVREGEKVLHLLETISPTAFMEQMFGVMLTMIYNSLVCLPAAKLPTVRRALAELHGFLEKVEPEEIKAEEREALYSRVYKVENLLARAMSLLAKLEDQDALVDGLLSEAEVDLREESQREVALHLFSTDDEIAGLYEPDAREFILRCTTPRPLAGGSRTVGHRLYALLTDSEFRVATAISADE